jgi:hypothetical protein
VNLDPYSEHLVKWAKCNEEYTDSKSLIGSCLSCTDLGSSLCSTEEGGDREVVTWVIACTAEEDPVLLLLYLIIVFLISFVLPPAVSPFERRSS